MRTRIPLVLTLLVAACGVSYDPGKVEIGMSKAELVQAVGEPREVLPMADGYEFWRYKGYHTVMIGKEGVVNFGIMSDADYYKTMQQLENGDQP